MRNLVRHTHHLVQESPWPILGSIGGFLLTSGIVKWFHTGVINLFLIGILALILVIILWWRDVRNEGRILGLHSKDVEIGLRWGIILFITSEVLFFVSFFWAYFHRSLAPNIEVGGAWPPIGIQRFNPIEVPLLNTIVLLSSGASVTWAHHSLIAKEFSRSIKRLIITVVLGLYFTALQALEYYEARFRIADRVYGSRFFLATGFHGLHVIVGTLFLITAFFRLIKGIISDKHHFGFEAAAWYWHFVDVVWLFLYISIYWWGGN